MTQTKHVQNIKGQHATTPSTAHRKRQSDVNVPGDVQGRLVQRRFPASRTVKWRIPIDDVADGIVTQLHVSNSTTTNFWPATWLSNALSVSQNRLTYHVLRCTAFIAAESRGQPCRFHCSSVQVTYANTRCGSHLAIRDKVSPLPTEKTIVLTTTVFTDR